MRTSLLTAFACLTLTLTIPCPAQDRPGENAAAARIAEGVEKARAGQLLDAVEQFQRVLDTAGDDLVPVDRHQLAPARWVVHGHLSRLPAEGVKLYRQRIDGQAAKRLEEAKKSRSDAGLNRLLADMFASRAGEEAILELARRAFERGEFDAAEHYWRMLLPGDNSELHYPDSKTSPAAVLARLVLVKLFQGERTDATAGLALLKEKHANESGLLAGTTGKYVETLADLMARPSETTLPRPPDDRDWPTFGGSPARTGSTRARLPYFWPDVPAWTISLPLLREHKPDTPPADPLHPKALAFHPIIVDGRAFVADGARLFSIDLLTGQSSTAARVKDGVDTVVPSRVDLRHTLTEADGVIYARMGAAAMKAPGGSFIAAFGKKPHSGDYENLWRLTPPPADGGVTHFEGTPVVRGNHLFAAVWRQAGAEAVATVACYRIDDPRTVPELVWQRPVGRAASEPNGEVRYRHDLLGLAGPNVVYATNGGTVIALDAATGRPAWEYRYPRDERSTSPRYRDLCPPLVDGGRIYVAPADTDRLMCLDAYTGRLIWERESIEVVHLLGVAKGRLIATIGGQVKGIRGFNLRTGADSGAGGWTIHDDAGETTFGRGLVSDEAVVWPTRHGLFFLNPADGTFLREPIRGSFGNLCFADGCLLVTTATEIWGYPTEAKKLGDRRKAVEADPADLKKQAALAQSLIDAGEYDAAEQAVAKSGTEADRLRWFLAERLIREGETTRALGFYKALADGKSAYTTAATVRRAERCEDKSQARMASRAVAFQGATVHDENDIPWPPRMYAELRFGELLDERGTGIADDPAGFHTEPGPETPVRFIRTSVEPPRGVRPVAVPLDPESPRLSLLSLPALPVASGLERRPTLDTIRNEDGSTCLRIGDRAIGVRRYGTFTAMIAPPTSTAGFHRNFGGGAGYLIAQLTNGRLLVRGPTDKAPREYPASRRPWPEPPTHVGGDRFLLADDGGLTLYDAKSWAALTDYTRPRAESWTGELMRVRVHEDHALAIISRNHGVEIDRLKLADLKRTRGTDPVFIGRELADVAFVGDKVIVAADGGLTAYQWATGERDWETPLPETGGIGWKLAVAPTGLIAYPAEAIRTTQPPNPADELGRGGWLGPGLLRLAGRSYHHWATRELPVLVFDPADGRLIQRLTFPALGPAAGVAVAQNGSCVVTGAGSWTLAPH